MKNKKSMDMGIFLYLKMIIKNKTQKNKNVRKIIVYNNKYISKIMISKIKNTKKMIVFIRNRQNQNIRRQIIFTIINIKKITKMKIIFMIFK